MVKSLEIGNLSYPGIEYRSSQSVVVSWTKKFLLGDRELVPSED
jgi:hypothetical protein